MYSIVMTVRELREMLSQLDENGVVSVELMTAGENRLVKTVEFQATADANGRKAICIKMRRD